MATLYATHLGPTSYRDGLALQEGLVRARAAGEVPDWVLYPDHPPVLTVGRSPSPGALKADPEVLGKLGIDVFEVTRGGDITWHGPGQLVGYPILDLGSRGNDLHKYLRDIEEVLIRSLATLGVTGARSEGRTGVWVGTDKIASIGIAVRRWVSYHGFALNVNPDLHGFELIHPCGLRDIRMTSVAAQCGKGAPGVAEVRQLVTVELMARFGFDEVVWTTPERARVAAGLPAAATAASTSQENSE